ncbi:MAG: limonene-1,2-epoxide hydrolase family protein [Novosphingobium sp.]|nr:limonene-1,2-epoxide hydrolase family protein [Novosphingobium sp.]
MPSEIVTKFVDLWEEDDGFTRAVNTYFRDDTVWENHGLLTTTGKDRALGFYHEFSKTTGMTAMKIDMLAIAAIGDKVLTERIDRILDAKGTEVMTVPVMGVFEIEDGKIAAWRDYFDTIANSP